MSDQDDDLRNFALAVVAGVVALVIAGVIALAASTAMDAAPAAAAAPAASAPAAAAANEAAPGTAASGAVDKIFFAVDSDALPADAEAVLAKVADAARAGNGSVLISGFHDASGNPEANAELAKHRAQQVQHALEAHGVAPERLILAKPAVTTGDGDPKEARRVELRLQ